VQFWGRTLGAWSLLSTTENVFGEMRAAVGSCVELVGERAVRLVRGEVKDWRVRLRVGEGVVAVTSF